MATAQQARPETHGSRTQTITPTPAAEAGPSQPSLPPNGVLKLRGGPSRKARVVWSEEVVDNEGMGRKTSKVCCIYTKPRAFDESSSESGSGSEDDHDHARGSKGKDGPDKGKGKTVRRKVDGGDVEESEPSSESDGGAGDGRARHVSWKEMLDDNADHLGLSGDQIAVNIGMVTNMIMTTEQIEDAEAMRTSRTSTMLSRGERLKLFRLLECTATGCSKVASKLIGVAAGISFQLAGIDASPALHLDLNT